MFDIGIMEILVIAVVALLIVGPEEFPYLLRTVGRSFGKIRRVVASVRDQFEDEMDKAEQIKQKIQEQTKLVNLHNDIESGIEKASSTLSKSVPAGASHTKEQETNQRPVEDSTPEETQIKSEQPPIKAD